MLNTRRRKPGGKRFFPRRKVCQFCVDKVSADYKDVSRNRRFISEWGKIESRRKTGTCSTHQRQLSLAIKLDRFLALLPYTGGHSLMDLSRPDPRGDRGRRPPFRDSRDGPPPSAPPVEGALPSPIPAATPGTEAPAAPAAGAPATEVSAADVAPVAETPTAPVAEAPAAAAQTPLAEASAVDVADAAPAVEPEAAVDDSGK